ncbi:MAG: pyridoxal kinase PdxY [Alphaproteobacteria bacterium]|nr:pyridoxal kinase PdxY [Alphaproteobacteria bacterium]
MRILSIQSHVAYGYVGNRAATFPLQRLGHDVWAVNTVEFSNHTGYGAWKGRVAAPQQVRDVIDGIRERGVFGRCDAVLSGYLGDAALGEVVLDAVAAVRSANRAAVWCCDPVIGDVGRGVFVRPDIPEFFRHRAVPLADVVTPNHFELEVLTGQTITTLDAARDAARGLLAPNGHAVGPRIALVTSLRHDATADGSIEMLAVTRADAWRIVTPLLTFAIAPNGTGDAVAALFLAEWLATADVAQALSITASAIFAVLEATARAGERELQLVAAQDALAAPPRRFAATRL